MTTEFRRSSPPVPATRPVEGRGTVREFDRTLHYGFVDGDDGRGYFIHESDMPMGTTLVAGDRVIFTPIKTLKGPRAKRLRRLGAAASP
jgi:cold shock CspA family protein